MSGDERARDEDRNAAIGAVEAAWRDGQIVELDRSHRIEQLRQSQTLSEIRMLTHDLQPSPGAPTSSAWSAAPRPAPAPYPPTPPDSIGRPQQVPYASPGRGGTTPRTGSVRGGCATAILVAVVLFIVGVAAFIGLTLFAMRGVFDDPATEPRPSSPFDPDGDPGEGGSGDGGPGDGQDAGPDSVSVLSRPGLRDLRDAVAERTGSTTVFGVVAYPTYAVVRVPVDGSSRRERSLYYDGSFRVGDGSPGTSLGKRFDLADVDPAMVLRLVRRVQRMVEQPTSHYAVLEAPSPRDGHAVAVYASNEFGESASVYATIDGEVVYSSPGPAKVQP